MKRPGMSRCWQRIPVVLALALAVCLGVTAAALGQEVVYPDPAKDGTVLPIPAPTYPSITEVDWRKVKPPPRFQLRPPKGAPMC